MSNKIFIKTKARGEKVYAYRMFVRFKTSVTSVDFFNFTPDNYVRSEAAFVEHNSIFSPDIVRCSALIFRPVVVKDVVIYGS